MIWITFINAGGNNYIMKMFIKRNISKFKKNIFCFAVASLVLISSVTYAESVPEKSAEEVEITTDEEIEYAGEYLKYIMALINDYYVEEVSIDELVKGAIAGMAGKLDQYSMFLDDDGLNKIVNESRNEFVGMGISYYEKYKDGYPLISGVYEDGPAYKAGIEKNDILISVDGINVKDMASADITSIVSGKKGKTIKVVVKRDEEDKEISVKIDEFITPTVFVSKLDEILDSVDRSKGEKVRYIQITEFADGTGKEFKKAVEKIKKQNVENVIIDLRFNGGGVTQAAYEICEILIKEGPFLNIKRKDGKYNVNSEDDNAPFKNIAILTNEATASASELVAAVLKDNGAVIVGSKTYGKGVTQAIIELKNIGALKMTTEEFFPMSGRKINGVGIVPDYEVQQIKVITSESTDIDKDVENALKALGYDIETNEKKVSVIKELQKKYGISETGKINIDTVSVLNNEIVNKNYTDDKVFEKATEIIFSKIQG